MIKEFIRWGFYKIKFWGARYGFIIQPKSFLVHRLKDTTKFIKIHFLRGLLVFALI